MLLTRISDRVSRSCKARWEKSGHILIITCIAVLAVSAFGGTLSLDLDLDLDLVLDTDLDLDLAHREIHYDLTRTRYQD
jgi:hypothetical protein